MALTQAKFTVTCAEGAEKPMKNACRRFGSGEDPLFTEEEKSVVALAYIGFPF
jgi:hypothetical protein